MALVDMWRENRDGVREKTVHQILAFAGEGKLLDGGVCATEFRQLLAQVPLPTLRRYSDECLNGDAQSPGLALQDIVNELGSRLGFAVQPGRYRGRRGESGHDGLWMDEGADHSIIAEVKSSTDYSIPLDPIVKYRESLCRDAKIEEEKSSVLIVVCQKDNDTTDLEAQIRGSRYAWDVRLISLEALFKMAALTEQTDDPGSAKLLRSIVVPREYTKLDSLLDIVSFVATDVRDETQEEPGEEIVERREGAYVSKLDRESLRDGARELLEKQIGGPIKVVNRTTMRSNDGNTLIWYAASKAYTKRSYVQFWFCLRDYQIQMLDAASHAFVACLCAGEGIVLVPWLEFKKHVPNLGQTTKGAARWRHVILQRGTDGKFIMRLKGDAPNNQVDISKWFVQTAAVN